MKVLFFQSIRYHNYSHFLFKLIRFLDETMADHSSPHYEELKKGLIIANGALFDEDALRTGFHTLRAKSHSVSLVAN